MFFAVAAWKKLGSSVRFDLPSYSVDKTNLGMRRKPKEDAKRKGTVSFDEQYRYQTDVG